MPLASSVLGDAHAPGRASLLPQANGSNPSAAIIENRNEVSNQLARMPALQHDACQPRSAKTLSQSAAGLAQVAQASGGGA
jgi:hypothetical protein